MAALIEACTYEVDNSVDPTIALTPPGDPASYISLVNYNDVNTIFINQPTTFTFKVKDSYPTSVSFDVDVYMDNNNLVSTDQKQGTFTINDDLLVNGTFSLKLVFRGPSGTGSLADSFGSEDIFAVREWLLVINKPE